MEPETRTCLSCNQDFTIRGEDIGFYEKMDVPLPTWCPQCRAQRRLSWYTETSFHKRPDSRTGEIIFSHFPPEAKVNVYEHDFWWSDGWDPMKYGREYDFNKPFFSQMQELLMEVPLASRSIKNLVRSDYSNKAGELKDCYLVFNATLVERTMYSTRMGITKDSMNCSYVRKSDLCYEGFIISNCYKAFWSSYCSECQNIYACRNCVNCQDCIGCVDLRNKRYHIWNQPHTKEEYEQALKDMRLDTYSGVQAMLEKFSAFEHTFPTKYYHGQHAVNSVGHDISHVKDVWHCQNVQGAEHCAYCMNLFDGKDAWDFDTWGETIELVYDCIECGDQSSNLRFCFDSWGNAHRLTYCIQCHSSSDLFGCIGLRSKKYCILNKQYSQEEYETLTQKIRKHMDEQPYTDRKGKVFPFGEFFPPEISPFSYQETVAQDYFPLIKPDAEKKGFNWQDIARPSYEPTISPEDMPDSIRDIKDDILKETVTCTYGPDKNPKCVSAFRIIPAELEWHRNMDIPLQRECWDCRRVKRIAKRNPYRFWKRQCMCDYEIYKNTAEHRPHPTGRCTNEFHTSYAPDRPEILYCEECYQAEVV